MKKPNVGLGCTQRGGVDKDVSKQMGKQNTAHPIVVRMCSRSDYAGKTYCATRIF